jgi:hypothetical protein
MTAPLDEAPMISHERVMAAFADVNRMIEQRQEAQTTAQSGAQGQ